MRHRISRRPRLPRGRPGSAWFAAHWTPDDVPALRVLVDLYDAVERGELMRAGELRLWMDSYGITPKGQQDRRWTRPETRSVATDPPPLRRDQADPYAHLRVVGTTLIGTGREHPHAADVAQLIDSGTAND